MKYCVNCNDRINSADAVFCPGCGGRLTELTEYGAVGGSVNTVRPGGERPVPGTLPEVPEKKKSKALLIGVLAGCLAFVIICSAAVFIVSGKFPRKDGNTEKAIGLIESGLWEDGLELIRDDDSVLASELAAYCGIEEAREDFLHALRGLVFHSIDSEYDDVICTFMDVMFSVRTEDFNNLPDQLRQNLIYYTIVCEMMEDGFLLPDAAASGGQELPDALYGRVLAMAKPYIRDYSPEDFWGMDVEESFRNSLKRFGEAKYNDIFSDEYITVLNTESLQTRYENVLRTGLTADRDISYYLLSGNNIGRKLDDGYRYME